MSNFKVSIIVPIYNAQIFLKKLIENLTNQTYRNIEIILVNDGSTDNSLNICNELQSKDNRIRVVDKENGGVSSARNKGIEVSNGDYVTFVDSDDNIDEDYIRKMVENIEDECCLIKCNYRNKLKEEKLNRDKYLEKIISGEILGVCWGYLFRKDLLEDIYFDEKTSYMEDTVFIIQYLLRIKNVKIIDNDLYIHNYNLESLTVSKSNIEKKIDGYLYSISEIEKILSQKNIYSNKYKEFLNNRKIKIIEAEFAKLDSLEEIKYLLNKKNIIDVLNIKKINYKYKFFINLLRKKRYNKILKYITIRKKVKKILKGK